jgi:hypothetical protein
VDELFLRLQGRDFSILKRSNEYLYDFIQTVLFVGGLKRFCELDTWALERMSGCRQDFTPRDL